ncbi:MAG TPA: adenylate/guanylate cyclase domain-containing protein [Roseiarcus sp.]|nr:adenylate/guanylate cyclase domain-containing protein [Roseiarcus sp.]
MTAARRLAAILAADVVGYSRLMGEDEAGTARAVREHREAAGPIIRGFGGRLVKTMGDGLLLEFPSVVAAVECAIAIQQQMAERNADVPEARRILYRIGVNLGDVLIDGEDILGDGVNLAARLEGIAEPGGICISGSAYDQVRGRIDANFVDLGERTLKNIAQPVRVYTLGVGEIARASASTPLRPAIPVKPGAAALLGIVALLVVIAAGGGYWFIANRPAAVATGAPAPVASNAAAPAEAKHLSIVVLPFTLGRSEPGLLRRRHHRESHDGPVAHPEQLRHRPQHCLHLQGQERRRQDDWQGTRRALRARRLGATRPEPGAGQRPAHRRAIGRASLGRPLRGRRRRPIQVAGSGGGAPSQCVEL